MSIKSINGIEVLNTSEIAQYLGLSLSVKNLTDIGFQPFAISPTATLWKKSDAADMAIMFADHLLKIADELQGNTK